MYEQTPFSGKSLEDLVAWLQDNHRSIAVELNAKLDNPMRMLYAVPQRVRDGMIVLADGTTWNPGSGGGFYGYYAGAWHKLG